MVEGRERERGRTEQAQASLDFPSIPMDSIPMESTSPHGAPSASVSSSASASVLLECGINHQNSFAALCKAVECGKLEKEWLLNLKSEGKAAAAAAAAVTVAAAAANETKVDRKAAADAKKAKKAKKRRIDMGAVRRRQVALKVSYEGLAYSGFSQNVGDHEDVSVEGCLFAALKKGQLIVDRKECRYSRCGRTDKGVSAAGQIVSVWLRSAVPTGVILKSGLPQNSADRALWRRPEEEGDEEEDCESAPVWKESKEMDYCKIINSALPPDIRVISWVGVTDDFSARFSCTGRVYRYYFVRKSLELARMKEGLDKMVGSHDFRNFAKMDIEHVSNFTRTIRSASLTCLHKDPQSDSRDLLYVQIEGNAFLWHMIRNIVQVLFYIGNGLESPDVVDKLLDVSAMPRKPNYKMATDFPLVLYQCDYNRLKLPATPRNLWDLQMHLEGRWESFAVRAEQIRDQIATLKQSLVDPSHLKDFIDYATARSKKKEVNSGGEGGDARVVSGASLLASGSGGGPITWSRALEILKCEGLDVTTDPDMSRQSYKQLCRRGVGLSYEEKLQCMKGKKKCRTEENMNKRKRDKDEFERTDTEFYKFKQMQGDTQSQPLPKG